MTLAIVVSRCALLPGLIRSGLQALKKSTSRWSPATRSCTGTQTCRGQSGVRIVGDLKRRGGGEIPARDLASGIAVRTQFGYALGLHSGSGNGVVASELHGQRRPDIAEAEHGDAGSVWVHPGP